MGIGAKGIKKVIAELATRAKAGDDLAMDYAARMKRASGQGFDVDTPFYHGTKSDFSGHSLKPPRRATESIYNREGVSGSYRPDVASRYAGDSNIGAGQQWRQLATQGRIAKAGRGVDDGAVDDLYDAMYLDVDRMQSELDRINQLPASEQGGALDFEIGIQRKKQEINDTIEYWEAMERGNDGGFVGSRRDSRRAVSALDPTGGNVQKLLHRGDIKTVHYDDISGDIAKNAHERDPFKVFGDQARIAKEQGFDGVRYDGIPEAMRDDVGEVVIFDPQNIRSTNAAFDPAKRESSNLLASLAPVGVGVGMMAGGEDANASLLGVAARNADKMMLNIAQKMERAGIGRDEIWKKTGFGRGADSKWRFEVSDEQARIKGNDRNYNAELMATFDEGGGGVDARRKIIESKREYMAPHEYTNELENVLEHDALYDNHPDLKGVIYRQSNDMGIGSASYDGASDSIRMSTGSRDSTRLPLLHEVGHAIQKREGFAAGGSPSEFTELVDFDALSGPLADFHQLAQQAGVSDSVLLGAPSDLSYVDSIDAYIDDVLDGIRVSDELEAGANLINELERSGGRLQAAHDAGTIGAKEQYHRLAGEVEARNVEARAGMTIGERRRKGPWATEDVPRALQTVRYGGVLGAGTAAALYTPEENKAYADRLSAAGRTDLISTGQRAEPDEFPKLEKVADFIDRYVKTPIPLMDEPLKGFSDYLRAFGEDKTAMDRYISAAIAAGDLMP